MGTDRSTTTVAGTAVTVDDVGPAAVALTAELVAVDSVNPGLVPGAAGEGAVVELLTHRLRRNGFETHVITPDGHRDRPSLVAIGPSGASGPTVLLTGHVDTVGVAGMPTPFDPVADGDRMTGRGTCDMKGGVAAMVVAAEALARSRTPGRVVLALVADEEDASLGAEAVITALPGLGVRPDVAVVGEPTWLAAAASLRGYALVEVVLEGRAAHSSQPERGVNAVTHLGRLLAAVEARSHDLPDPGGSLMVTVAAGGESPFVLARSARAVVERRTVPGESSQDALAEVEDLLDTLHAADPTVTATATLTMAREAWRADSTGPAATFSDDLLAALGDTAPAKPFHAPYWMEAPLWQAAGIPVVVCGPAGGGLHAADEWVDLRQVRAYAQALVDAVTAWSGRHAD
ncbi:M20/M25/M40 family metallo-hydrolase [Oryzobacter telluris]|uniref:M20/M25/M40 family metallo-hydrolase n=1 Tax=Oryzobacter telluris TaxID=3149179 RepID=UPI00370D8BBF